MIDTDPWCDACPFDHQASLLSPAGYSVTLHQGGSGDATLLANAGSAGHAISLFDPASGWSVASKAPLGYSAVVAPTENFPYILSQWHGILRLREPSGMEENVSCEGAHLVPAGIAVDEDELQIVAGWERDAEVEAWLLTRPIAEPERDWERTFIATFDHGPLHAARDSDGQWLVVGRRGFDAALVRGGESVAVSVGASSFEDAPPLELVVGESFAAVATPKLNSLELTFDDGRTVGLPTPAGVAGPICDGSTFCGGRCVLDQRVVHTSSTFAVERFLMVAFVETTLDATILFEDVPCSEGGSDVCECREVVERDESRSELVFARFDSDTLHGERALAVTIEPSRSPTLHATTVEDRVVFALSRAPDSEETCLGSLPLSTLLP